MDWYAIFVESGQEEFVQKSLSLHFEESILQSIIPKRILIEKKQGEVHYVSRIMFPGYVLIRTNMDINKYKKIVSLPRIIRILSDGNYYSRIDDKEMDIILTLTGNSDTVSCSKILFKNSKVYVKSGPLVGMEGMIKKINKHQRRAKIVLDFMGQEKVVDVGVELLE